MERQWKLAGAVAGWCLAGIPVQALDAEPEPDVAEAISDDDCLACHGDLDLLQNGQERRLFVDAAAFAATSHGTSGCTSCHASVTSDHPDDRRFVQRAECVECHEETARQYAASRHHDEAICRDCHNPHDSRAAAVTTAATMNRTCGRCHHGTELTEQHAKWLPQTDYHLAALPCVACHTGAAEQVIALVIGRMARPALGEPLSREDLERLAPAERPLSALVDGNVDGRVTLDELRKWNRGAGRQGLRMQAVMLPAEATHDYGIQRNRRDCTFCHAHGADAKQGSYVVFPDETDGRWTRIPVQDGAVMDLLYGTPDFYMIGATATRNPWMDLAGFGVMFMGAGFVGAHSLVRVLTRDRRKRKGG